MREKMQPTTRSLDLTRSTDFEETLRILKAIPRAPRQEEEEAPAIAADAATRSFLPLVVTVDRGAELGWAEVRDDRGGRRGDEGGRVFTMVVCSSCPFPPGASRR